VEKGERVKGREREREEEMEKRGCEGGREGRKEERERERKGGRGEFTLLSPLCSTGAVKRKAKDYHCTLQYQALPETHPEIMFYQPSGYPLTQPSWQLTLTITTIISKILLTSTKQLIKASTNGWSFSLYYTCEEEEVKIKGECGL
jgi:hypothetical protein